MLFMQRIIEKISNYTDETINCVGNINLYIIKDVVIRSVH